MMKLFSGNTFPDFASPSASRLVSYSRQIPNINLLNFLKTAPVNARRVYWENQQVDLAFAGYGIAAELFADGADRVDVIRQNMQELFANLIIGQEGTAPRLFGGFAFQPDFQPEGIWSAFPSAYFVLPHYLLTRDGDHTWLTINACITSDQEQEVLKSELAALAEQLANLTITASSEIINSASVSYPLELPVWRRQINDATRRMKAAELEKVVLSRSCDVSFDHAVDPLQALAKLETPYADTYRFLIEPLPGNAFFGATPELLITRDGRYLFTAALAASIKRGTTSHEDDQLAVQLFQNTKERHEHNVVVLAMKDLLVPLTTKLHVPQSPGILKLSNIQHLRTPITGELNDDYHVLQLVERLHPTPALGGYPRNIALETIRTVEPISRGWYAAPVGWVDADGNGTFAAAIRSAVSSGQQARLYAGVGVVADSDPDREWDETHLKFRPMLGALSVPRL